MLMFSLKNGCDRNISKFSLHWLVPRKLLQRFFLLFFLLPDWLKLNHLKSRMEGGFSDIFFTPYLFHRSRNNRRDKLRSMFWLEKMFRKPHLKLLRDDSRSMEPTNI